MRTFRGCSFKCWWTPKTHPLFFLKLKMYFFKPFLTTKTVQEGRSFSRLLKPKQSSNCISSTVSFTPLKRKIVCVTCSRTKYSTTTKNNNNTFYKKSRSPVWRNCQRLCEVYCAVSVMRMRKMDRFIVLWTHRIHLVRRKRWTHTSTAFTITDQVELMAVT